MKKFKYTILGQFLSVIKSHAAVAFVFMFIWLIAADMWVGIAGKIFYTVGCLCYFLTIYNAGTKCAAQDKRSISPLKPYPAKGITLCAALIVLNLIVIALYKVAWNFGSDGEFLNRGWAVLLNIISIYWTAPYNQLLGMEKGVLELSGYFIIFLLPIIATTLGYLAGYKGIDIFEKISGIAYEKNK